MISKAINIISDELNSYLGRKEPRYREANTAIVSDLVSQTGELVITTGDADARDNIIITLINIEEETIGKAQLPHLRNSKQELSIANPEIQINLYLLFSAFSNMADEQRYGNCLTLISLVIQFFQYKHLFNQQNTPAMDSSIKNLVIDLVSPSFEQQNHIWGTVGAKQMPSVIYKVRALSIREIDDAISGPLIKSIKTDSKHQS